MVLLYRNYLSHANTRDIANHPVININKVFNQTPSVGVELCLDMSAAPMSA